MGARIVGIDFGTTNSCVAVLDGGPPRVVPIRGHPTTPSVVAMTASGKRLVGHRAKRQAITNAENTVYALKRFIGRKFESEPVQRSLHTTSFHMKLGEQADVHVQLREMTYTLPELGAMILEEVKAGAEEHLGEPVERAVVTVPAYFSEPQRRATRRAGEIAGLDVVRIINEPTAAAIAYGFGRKQDRTVAIFDLGGGTFDVSVVRLWKKGTIEVLATGGDTFLGGEDFDQRIMDWLCDRFRRDHGVDLREDRVALQRLKDAAENVKCELSSLTEAQVDLPFLAAGTDGDGIHLRTSFSRATFEQVTQDLVDRTIEAFRDVLKMAALKASDLDEVLLVGGMTRMPRVREAVHAFSGHEPSKGIHPDEAVALGAAIHAAALAGTVKGVKLADVTPRGLGVVTAGRGMKTILPRNTPVPASRQKTFTTSRDGQTRIKFVVMQGEGERASDNEFLGEFRLDGLRGGPKGAVTVEVTLSIDEDGILRVSAVDADTRATQSIELTSASRLGDSEE